MNGLKALLVKSYPFDPEIRKHLLLGGCLFLWVFGFLWFSEPFEIWRFTLAQKLTLLPIYSAFCSVSYFLSLFFQSFLYRSRKPWRAWHEVTVILLAVIIAFLFMYLTYYHGVEHYSKPYSVGKYFRLIYLPALLIFLPFVIIGRLVFGKRNQRALQPDELIIQGKGKYEYLKVKLNALIFMKSLDNYIEIFYWDNHEKSRKTLRQNLNDLEADFPFLLRTHRSYLVNTIHIKECFFKNKNLFLVLQGDIEIPVSRSMKRLVMKHLPLAKI